MPEVYVPEVYRELTTTGVSGSWGMILIVWGVEQTRGRPESSCFVLPHPYATRCLPSLSNSLHTSLHTCSSR